MRHAIKSCSPPRLWLSPGMRSGVRRPTPPLRCSALDPDKDGTVDLAEAKAAASALFDKLEKRP